MALPVASLADLMGNSPSSLADHPLHDAKKGKWQDYFGKLNNSKVSVNDAVPKVSCCAKTWALLLLAAAMLHSPRLALTLTCTLPSCQ
eukprot:scaffold274308_cov35-Tisochrysis_lutea.AAC.1